MIEEARELLTPSPAERERVASALRRAVERLSDALSDMGVEAIVEPVGSATRGTWLPGSVDLDLFILLPPETPGERLGCIAIEAASRAFGNCEVRYSSHPYARSRFEGLWVEVVPAYLVGSPSEIISPVDRTPFHSRFLSEKIDEELAGDVRLLKAFMKSLGVYGAEIAVEGFSGYLCELLVIRYSGFVGVLLDAPGWREPQTLYLPEAPPVGGYQPAPLIFPDPVDPRRNAAAAVGRTQFHRFRAACSQFLRRPSVQFFRGFVASVDRDRARRVVEERGTRFILAVFSGVSFPPDVAWGQLKSLRARVERELRETGFGVLDSSVWYSDRGYGALVVELTISELPPAEKRRGPPVGSPGEAPFLEKHLSARDTLGGPFIQGDRWFVLKRRRWTSAIDLFKHIVEVARPSSLRGARVSVYTDLGEILSLREEDLVRFLLSFILRREPFLEPS